jgi:hypothetical protein
MKIKKIYEKLESNSLIEFLKEKEKMYDLLHEFFILDDQGFGGVDITVVDLRLNPPTSHGKTYPLEIELTENDTDQSYARDIDVDEYNRIIKFLKDPEYYKNINKYNL